MAAAMCTCPDITCSHIELVFYSVYMGGVNPKSLKMRLLAGLFVVLFCFVCCCFLLPNQFFRGKGDFPVFFQITVSRLF